MLSKNTSTSKSTSFHTVVFVAHGGELEVKSALLAASLYQNYTPGKIACCIIEPFDQWGKADPEVLDFFEELGVELFTSTNDIDITYPHGNKIASLSSIDGPAIFLDSDIFLLCPFSTHLDLNEEFCAKPADIATFTQGGGDWGVVYALFGLACPVANFRATITGDIMLPYYNAGFIRVKNGAEFSEMWVDTAKQIDRFEQIKNKRPWLDQIALPVTVKRLGWKSNQLNDDFNYPCHLQKLVNSTPYFAHYHWPDVILESPVLFQHIKQLINRHPMLYRLMEKYNEWHGLVKEVSKSSLTGL